MSRQSGPTGGVSLVEGGGEPRVEADLGRSGDLPPGPRVPSAVTTLRWAFRPIALMERAQRRYGDVFSLPLYGMGRVVFVSDPELIKRVFTGPATLLHAGEAAQILRPVVGRNSVLLLDEAEHMRQRKLLLPPFHGQVIERYGEIIREVTARAVDQWPTDRSFRLQPRMAEITLEVIIRAVFGVDEAERQAELRLALRRMLDEGTAKLAFQIPWLRRDFGPIRHWTGFQAMVGEVDRLLYAEIARRRSATDLAQRSDVMSLLLQARDEDGRPMGDEELRDELVTLLTAGHETTATALAWAFELLFHNPRELRVLRKAVAGGDEDHVDAVAKETLRLRPVIPIVARRLTDEMELGGFALPRGSIVSPCIYLTHRRPDLYPEPEAFRPERFLERPPATYGWLPFGGGVRRCIGASFAQYEMRVVLGSILERCEIGPAGPPQRIGRRSITLAPSAGTPAVLRRRSRGRNALRAGGSAGAPL